MVSIVYVSVHKMGDVEDRKMEWMNIVKAVRRCDARIESVLKYDSHLTPALINAR